MTPNFELIRFRSAEELARDVAGLWLKDLKRSAGENCRVALSGGRIAKVFFDKVAELGGQDPQLFERVDFFWADERCVPPTDPESNYALARKHLLDPLRVAEAQRHRIQGELEPDEAARRAAQDLVRQAPLNDHGVPVLDLVFLGMGENGHVASLFPGDSQMMVQSREVYRAVVATKPPPRRVTMGFGVICAARRVWVLISGEGKTGALNESVSTSGRTPLGRVLQGRGGTTIFVDRA